MTKIEWTDRTWNPITGCTQCSLGCAHCYAKNLANRLRAMHIKKYSLGFTPTIQRQSLYEPYGWKKPCNIFVCSMSDLFHESIPFDYIDEIFGVMKNAPQHRFQVLTKRVERMTEFFTTHKVPSNVWIGTTVESSEYLYRIDYLRNIPSTIRFLSCEPLLSDLGSMNLQGIDWIIVGGESGISARPMKIEWVRNIRNQAIINSIPFFFKQWGSWGEDGIKRNKSKNGKLLDGAIVQEYPKINKSHTL